MLEQPFPVDFLADEATVESTRQWRELKDVYFTELGVLLFADESVSTADDVAQLVPYVHGVNIKLEKAGM
jgi:hypothetical protein